MTKPLTIFMELGGGILFIVAMIKFSIPWMVIGAAIIIIGALGHRKREKNLYNQHY